MPYTLQLEPGAEDEHPSSFETETATHSLRSQPRPASTHAHAACPRATPEIWVPEPGYEPTYPHPFDPPAAVPAGALFAPDPEPSQPSRFEPPATAPSGVRLEPDEEPTQPHPFETPATAYALHLEPAPERTQCLAFELAAKQVSLELKRRPEPRWMAFLAYPYLAIALGYLVWRSAIIAWDVWYGPVVYAAELFSLVSTALFVVIAREIHDPVFRPTALKRTVDVFIATYTESLDVLEPVVIGAMRVRGRRNVLVLDDGNRPEVAAMAEKHGAIWIPRTTNEHAKAGNLNHGLLHSDAEFILELDADHVPLPSFIERTLGYFDDPQLAFVQTPQTYYNRDTFLFRFRKDSPKYWFEQRMFYDAIQPAKNRWNAAFFVGTSAILRRSAIDSIGGFATESATEDIHTAARLHARGWKSVFVPEVLAYGLEAENYKEFYKQRRRWAAGSLGLLMRSPDSPLRAKGFTLGQRANYLYSTMAHFQGAQKLALFALPIICLLALRSPITGDTFAYCVFFSIYLCLSLSITAIYARGTYHLLHTEAYNLASLPAQLGGLKGIFVIQKKFAVSRKSKVKKERSWAIRLLWLMLVVAAAATVRGLWLLAHGNHSGIVIAALVFTMANLVCLASFLTHLWNYERAAAAPPAARTPHGFYTWILRLHEQLRREERDLRETPEPWAVAA